LRPQDTAKLEQIRRPVAAPAATSGSTREDAAAVDSELEAENAALAQELVQRSGQRTQDITALHQQMAEIAEQNQRLAHMLHDQNEVIDTLHQDAEVTEDNVDEGNRQLQQAVSRDSHGFRNLVVGLLLGASACLLFLDWYS
jgi:t-SNARE complex subunit (syntaxin)